MSSRVIVWVVALRPRLVERVADARAADARGVTALRDAVAAARVVRVGVVVVRADVAWDEVTVRADTPREDVVMLRSRIGVVVVVRDVTVEVAARRDETGARSRDVADWDAVADTLRRGVPRDEFVAAKDTAVVINNGAIHAAKSSLIPFILFLINIILSYLKKRASGNNEILRKFFYWGQ